MALLLQGADYLQIASTPTSYNALVSALQTRAAAAMKVRHLLHFFPSWTDEFISAWFPLPP